MILRKKNKPFKYDGKTYFIGEEIVALNNSEYSGLFGRIVEIRNGADKETDNKTPDIYCEFDPPLFPKDIEELEKRFSCLYKAPKKLDDITLDSVIMPPDMIKSVAEKTDGHKITIYSLEEDWAYDDDYGHTTEIISDYMLAKKKLCEKIKNEKEDGSVERWLDDEELIEDYGNDYYEAYLDGYYSSSHYLVSITSHNAAVNDSVVSDIANAYIDNSRVEDFVSQIEQWDEVEKMTDKQYNAMITNKDLPDRIRSALSKNDTYWEAYWQSISELAFRMVEEYSKKQFSEENKNNAIS
jgi:hypothetical protein